MKIDRIEDKRPLSPDDEVTVKLCGNIAEIRYMHSNFVGGVIKKLNAHQYVDMRTGEIKDFEHTTTREQSKGTVSQSLRNLRDIINANLTDPSTVLWITLTYRENMQDTKRLYEDYRKFWLRFSYFLKKQNLPSAEYIIATEPQGRGAWHIHGLFIFPRKAPYIPNKEIARLWGHGFCNTKSLKNISNPGLYLTSYLTDIDLDKAMSLGISKGNLKSVDFIDETGNHKKKAILKGGRLKLYPSNFKLYRTSKGIKRPKIIKTTEEKAQEIVENSPLIYEKTLSLVDEDGEIKNIINYRQFNLKGEKTT